MSAPAGVGVSLIYTNHRGETATRQVVITGRIAHGFTEWHPAALWTFEVWDRKHGALRMFDPKGVLGDPLELMARIAKAAGIRDAIRDDDQGALRRRLTDAERNLAGERSSREREQRKAWNLDAQLAVTRGALRGALEAVPALERRRDELLATTNRYLARARRMRAAIEACARVTRKSALAPGPEGDAVFQAVLAACEATDAD